MKGRKEKRGFSEKTGKRKKKSEKRGFSEMRGKRKKKSESGRESAAKKEKKWGKNFDLDLGTSTAKESFPPLSFFRPPTTLHRVAFIANRALKTDAVPCH